MKRDTDHPAASATSSASRTIRSAPWSAAPCGTPTGGVIGRIVELTAEIELHAQGNSYVVTHVAIGQHRWLDLMLSGRSVPPLMKRWRRSTGYRYYEVPWHALDLRDPAAPRLRGRREEFATEA